MDNHTAPELLESVGIDWRAQYGRESQPSYEIGGDNTAYFAASNEIKYTGPGLGTPELDALLLVAGLSWIRERCKQKSPCDVDDEMFTAFGNDIGWESRIVFGDTPGHALARAIREVSHA